MNADTLSILKHYPQVYLACHVDHVRKRSNEYELSDRDSSILSHLSQTTQITAADLARHIGVQPSTLSAALKRLQALGYIERNTEPGDRRVHRLTLTKRGEIAMAATSVLDPARVAALLARLSARDRACAIEGLALLAAAAKELHPQRSRKQR
jgi:DNA-binding MarR family transcriptional regulator